MAQRTGVNAVEFAGFDDLGTNGWKTLMERELRGLDVKVQSRVLDRGINTPPGSPASGAAYIVGTSPTGAWSGHANAIARWNEYALEWEFWAPKSGWAMYVVDEGRVYEWTGSVWDLRGVEKRETPDARAFGAAGTGTGDDTTAVAAAIAATSLVQEFPVTAFVNPRGAKATPSGVAHNQTTGRVYNPSQDYNLVFGQETLNHWFSRFAGNSRPELGAITTKKIVLSGDSTTWGAHASYAFPATMLKWLARDRGYGGVLTVNRGQPGKNTNHWLSTFLAGDMTENPDLLILRWGANDPFNDPDNPPGGNTVDQFLSNLRTGLATIRASKSVSQMSILLMTPTPMNDVPNGRDEVWSEQINAGIRQAARDYKCAFADTYRMFQNAHDAAGIWMDSIVYGGVGRAIHPNDIFYEHIARLMADVVLPTTGVAWRNNQFFNPSQCDTGTPANHLVHPSTYTYAGLDMRRMDSVASPSGWGSPYDGAVITFRSADDMGLQLSFPHWGTNPGRGISARAFSGDVMGPWFGSIAPAGALLTNGWTEYNTGNRNGIAIGTTLDGRAYLRGNVAPGAVADGSEIMFLPDNPNGGNLRPAGHEDFVCASENGIVRIRVQNNGQVRLYGFQIASAWVCLSGCSWKIQA